MIEVQVNNVFVGIGSNEGNKILNLKKAVKEISKIDSCVVEKVSSIYETFPFGNLNQANFLNAVLKIKSTLTLNELFVQLKGIEKKLGRIKREKWGPREIDLDILLYNDLIFSDEIITLPHEGLIYRDFVLVPLVEIEPELFHPVFKRKVSEFISELETHNIINKYSDSQLLEETDFDK